MNTEGFTFKAVLGRLDFVASMYIICHFRRSVRVQTGLFHLLACVDPVLCRQGLCAPEAHRDLFLPGLMARTGYIRRDWFYQG